MIKVSILTIGDEICIGQIVNTNASWIASRCTEVGARVMSHVSVPDEKDLLMNSLDSLLNLSDVVLCTGGLGPTHDDITKPVLTEYFDDKLTFHKPTYDYLTELYQKRGIEFTVRNKELANLPSKCSVLHNRVGSAPGMLFKKNDKFVFSMPGVPSEMKAIMTDHAIPFINKLIADKKEDIVLYRTLQTIGIAESTLADLLGEPDEFLNGGTLAFLPSYKGVKLRIGFQSKDFDSAEKSLVHIENYIRNKAGRFVYAVGEEAISAVVGTLLREKGKTVAVAESCTGGMLGAAITDIAGSSDYFSGGVIVYSNESKINILKINREVIEKHGAVSEETAIELANRVRQLMNTDYGIGITGIAGPGGGSPEKPVGTVWIGISYENSTIAKKFVFSGDRAVNRELSVGQALGMLYSRLK
jgi:nicotinamide-nucleotide amidase